MILLNNELKDKIFKDVLDKILKYSSWDSPVRDQIARNFGWWGDDDNLFRLKIDNTQRHIRKDLNETD